MAKHQVQPCQQIMTETTSDTGRADHPTVAQKAPCKIFCKAMPIKEEETERVTIPSSISTSTTPPPTKRGLGIGKD